MLNKEQPYILISPIDIPYKFIKYNKNVVTYIKDYDVNTPLYIENIKEVKYTSNCMVLLLHNKQYYWCPIVQDLYRSYTRDFTRYKFMCSVRVIEQGNTIFVHFSYKKKEYRVTEVKKIICK